MFARKPPPQPPLSFKMRFQIGASLIPPFALLYLASRAGWMPAAPKVWLAAMPVALLVGMLLPRLFAPWHRLFSSGHSWLGHRLLKLLLALVFLLTIVPIAVYLRIRGRSFLETASRESYWLPPRTGGSMQDQY